MGTDKEYKFSVIVPIYNKEKYIARCLESLQSQSIKEFEIICVDDGSTDSSNKQVREWMHRDDRILLLENKENRGVSYARNLAINRAGGKYLFFLDADDYLDSCALKQYYNEINKANADMLFFNFAIKQESRHRYNCEEGIHSTYAGIYDGQELLGSFVQNDEFFLYACMVIYNREFVLKHNLRFMGGLKCGEGGEFILAALTVAARVIVSRYKGYYYCLNDCSVNAGSDITEEALYGQIVQYIHMLQRTSKNPESEGMCAFLDWYRSKIAGGIANLSEETVRLFARRMENEYSRHVWALLANIETQEDGLLSDDDLQLLRKERTVLVYGAGRETLEMLKLLNSLQIELLGIVVTQKEGNPDVLYGHKVQSIDLLCNYDSNTLIVITAHSKHQETIAAKLEAYGFHRHIGVRRR